MNTTCPNCTSLFRNVDRDEDGRPEVPESQKCASRYCETRLCPAGCQELSFSCAGCNQRFCNDHLHLVDGLKFCRDCYEESRLLLKMPVEVRCEECGCSHDDVFRLAEWNGYTGPDPICCEVAIR